MEDGEAVFDEEGMYGLEVRCIKQLSRIVEATGAVIVLSSTWRHMADMKAHLLRSLEKVGGARLASAVVDDTPDIEPNRRGEEIVRWLETHSRRFGLAGQDRKKNTPDSAAAAKGKSGPLKFAIFEDSEQLIASMRECGLSKNILQCAVGGCDLDKEGITSTLADRAIEILTPSFTIGPA